MEDRTAHNPKTATGGGWDKTGPMQLDRLKKYGMKPEDKLFDFGCGTLRGGQHIIKYLDTGNYFGTDISLDILEEAKKLLKSKDLDSKKPSLYFTNDNEFEEVKDHKFDYLHAQSVLSHMPPEDIEILFKNIPKIMHRDSKFLATFFLSRDGSIYPGNNHQNYSYPLTWIKETGDKHGLDVDMIEDDKKQKLLMITLKSEAL